MKFISRSSNYMLVLKPGIPGSSITGTASIPGFYVRFRDGIVDVKDEETIRLIKMSEGFKNGEFVAAEESGEDPFADNRTQTEPTHVLADMKYGHIEKSRTSETPFKMPASMKKVIAAEATKMAKSMAKDMVKEMIPGLLKELATQGAAAQKSETSTVKTSIPATPVTPTTSTKDVVKE